MKAVALLLLFVPLAGCLSDGGTDGPSDGGTDPSMPHWPDWGDLETATIRPGASLGGYCTFNFLFEAPDGTGYIGTAAHCTDEVGERLRLGGGAEFATVVYDSDRVDSGVDFTLARIDDDRLADAHPQVWAWQGPTGTIRTDDLEVGDRIDLYGYGVVVGQEEPTRARSGVLTDWDEDEYNVDMPAVNGDSGAPLLHETGMAFGIVSRYGAESTPPSTDRGPMMGYILRELAAAGFEDVRLVTI